MDRDLELALVRGLRNGEAAAFDAVYDEYHRRLFNFLARVSRRRDVAEDLTEETWLRLVAHARRLDPETRLGPWLFTVARNLHVSYCRSRVLDESLSGELIGLWVPAPRPSSPFDEAVATELEDRVERALARLPAACREVLLLVAAEGFSPSEAARICGVAPQVLRQRLYRARAMLARVLREPPKVSARTNGEVSV
jgi:RNA polymerase sigma factor (sigma-70 family)